MSDDFLGSFEKAARRNPVSAVLIGMGAAWLLLGSRPVQQVADLARDWTPDLPENGVQHLRDAVGSGVSKITDGVSSGVANLGTMGGDTVNRGWNATSEYAQSVVDYAGRIPDVGFSAFDNIRANVEDLFRTQPLAVSLVGVAIGAGIGAALPVSDLENTYIGPAHRAAANVLAEQGARALDVADEVISTVKQEAANQGLTSGGASNALDQFSAKISKVLK